MSHNNSTWKLEKEEKSTNLQLANNQQISLKKKRRNTCLCSGEACVCVAAIALWLSAVLLAESLVELVAHKRSFCKVPAFLGHDEDALTLVAGSVRLTK